MRWLRLAAVATGIALAVSASLGVRGASASDPAYLDPLFQEALASSSPLQRFQGVAVLDHLPGGSDLTAIEQTGAQYVAFEALPMIAFEGTKTQILAITALPAVSSLWRNHSLELLLRESVPLIQADVVHAAPLGFTGTGVRVAVIDSGIDGLHADLHYPEHTIQNVKLFGYQKVFADLVLSQEDVVNTDTTAGHGTHVAGIIAGTGVASGGYYTGVAPGADLIGLGAADGTDLLTGIAAYDWVLGHREQYDIRVINNSWGDGTITYDERDPLNVASKAAHDGGITVVFAAGNDGQEGMVYNRYAWPDWVIGVAGGEKTGKVATYSSRGDDVHHPAVTAPGSFIASARASTGVVTDANSTPFDFTDPLNPRMVPPEWWAAYTVALGTSMAAPHVAGVAALMLEANPGLTPDQIKSMLGQTATPISGCPVSDCGAGYVNALAAVGVAQAALNHAPVASLTVSVTSGAAPLVVTLDASLSSDADGWITSYRWDLEGDGDIDLETIEPSLTFTYPAGVFHPFVSVVDDDGLASLPAGGVEIRVSNPPHASASVPKHGKDGQAVTFDASSSWDPDGDIAEYRYTFGDGSSISGQSTTVTHTYAVNRPTTFAWTVTVVDEAGVLDAVGGWIKITP